MTARELDIMVRAMRTKYNKVESRGDISGELFYLWKGLSAIGRHELAEKLMDLYMEIENIDTSALIQLGTFDERRYEG